MALMNDTRNKYNNAMNLIRFMAVARIISGVSQRAHHQLRFGCHPATPTTHFRPLSSTSLRIDPDAEWFEAQKIRLSVDLSASATQLLKFLAAIDRNRDLYEGPALHRAIYRYKNCWLPLLAKQSELATLKRPLVVPLDCEWIWHVHRLNPKHYKTDCEELYGRVLDNANVESTTQRTCNNQMKEIWNSMSLGEPFDLDLSSRLIDIGSVNYNNHSQKSTNYDLVSAVKRQCTFFYQVSRPFMNNALFLKEAIARYKGFLHLIRKNKEESLRRFCVPTYDIDLIWHAHQLHPTFYCMDTTAIYGEFLDHDDTVSDRSKDTKLNVGFMDTTKEWEKLYGLRYWKAGAMFRGNTPSSLAIDAVPLKEAYTSDIIAKESQNVIQLPKKMQMEVLLEIVDVKGLPQGQKDKLFVVIRQKYQNNRHSPTKKLLAISSESMKTMKQVIIFQSEPTTELLVELMSSTSTINDRNSNKIIGSTTISFADVVDAAQELLVDRWFELLTPSESKDTKLPLSLRISMSFTPLASAAYMLHMVISQGYLNHTSVLDDNGNPVIELYLRCLSDTKREIVGIWRSLRDSILAKNVGKGWCLMDSQWELRPCNKTRNVYELLGQRKVIFMPGKKLEYESEQNSNKDNLKYCITAIEFSPENPYGKVVALLDIKSGVLQIKEDWFLLPGVISAYCLLHQALGWEYETPKDKETDLHSRRNDIDNFNVHVLYDTFFNSKYGGDGNTAESVDNTEGGDSGNGEGGSSGGSCGESCGGGCGGCGG